MYKKCTSGHTTRQPRKDANPSNLAVSDKNFLKMTEIVECTQDKCRKEIMQKCLIQDTMKNLHGKCNESREKKKSCGVFLKLKPFYVMSLQICLIAIRVIQTEFKKHVCI